VIPYWKVIAPGPHPELRSCWDDGVA